MNTWLTAQLKKHKTKVTPLRRLILDWIAGRKGIFSAADIRKNLPCLDKVSVYRTLELFNSLDLIHSVGAMHGQVHYEVHGEEHHHHVVCSHCEKTMCISCPIIPKKIKGFSHIHHSFILTGLCDRCAAD